MSQDPFRQNPNPFTNPDPSSKIHYGPYSSEPQGSPLFGVFSMICGVMSWFTCCLVLFSIPLSLGAIVLGHMGYRNQAGRVMAGVGMLLGYTCLICAIGFTIFFHVLPNMTPRKPAEDPARAVDSVRAETPGEKVFQRTQAALDDESNQNYADGNTTEAKQAAEEFADTLKSLAETLFIGDDKEQFVTWCEIHEGTCCFLVRIPGYNNYDSKAKEALDELAWKTAQAEARKHVGDAAKVGLGIKGDLTYGTVRVGILAPKAEDEAYFLYDGDAEGRLYEFFDRKEKATPDARPESTPRS